MSESAVRPSSQPRPPGLLAGHLALVAVQFCFGLFPIFALWAFAEGAFTPFGVAGWRMLAGALVLGAIAFGVHGRGALPTARDLPLLCACSLLGVTFNQGLYLQGLSRSSAVDAGLVMALIPVFTFSIAALVRQERFRPLRAVGVVIALLGTLPLLSLQGIDLEPARRLGNLLMVLNALSYSAYLVLSRPLAQRYPPLVLIAWVYVLALPAVPIFAWNENLFPLATPRAYWSMGFIIVFATILGYLLNVFALSRLRASTTATYVYSQPLITGLAGTWFLGEKLSASTLQAAAFIFCGIYLVSRRPRSKIEGVEAAPASLAAISSRKPASERTAMSPDHEPRP